MPTWAIACLIIAVLAGAVGLTGVAGPASGLAQILFVAGVLLALAGLISGRR